MRVLRIYADFNGYGRDAKGRLVIPLDTRGSLRDLTNAGVRLRDGLPLTVVDWSDDTEDLEADATAEYDQASGVWVAVIGAAGYRYVPKGNRAVERRFLCLGCRRDLGSAPTSDQHSDQYIEGNADACPDCGTPVRAAIAAPDASGGPGEPAA